MEEFLIRDKPEFKLLLTEDQFKIHNKAYPQDNKNYSYSDITDIKITPREINWISTLIIHIFSFFGGGTAIAIRKKNKLRISTIKSEKEEDTLLINCDLQKVEIAIEKVKNKIGKKTNT